MSGIFLRHTVNLADRTREGKVFSSVYASVGLFVCLSVFNTISQKLIELASPNMTQTWPTTSPKNKSILRSKGQRSRSRGTKSAEWWLFLLVQLHVGLLLFWNYYRSGPLLQKRTYNTGV